MSLNILEITYLIASLTFIVGLKMLSHLIQRERKPHCCSRYADSYSGDFDDLSEFDSDKLLNYGLIFLGLL